MALTIPNYIQRADITNSPIRHAWADPASHYQFLGDERLANRIRSISLRGMAGLSAGFAEWIAWRLDKYFQDPLLLNYIEAVWAGIVDWRYMRPRESVPGAPHYFRDWQGPVRGPVISTFNSLDEIIRGIKKPVGAGLSSASLAQLALYVMPDPKPFKDWRRSVITRLAKLYPYDDEDPIGPPVPREVIDPELDYQPEASRELLARFLQGLNPGQNPFLRSAEEMLAQGFAGTPYTL